MKLTPVALAVKIYCAQRAMAYVRSLQLPVARR